MITANTFYIRSSVLFLGAFLILHYSEEISLGATNSNTSTILQENEPEQQTQSLANGWTKTVISGVERFSSISFGDGTLIAVGRPGVIVRSEDGKNWELSKPGLDDRMSTVCFGNKVWVAGGSWYPSPQSLVYSTDNGRTWKNANAADHYGVNSVIFDGTQFYAVTFQGYIMRSIDGENWEDLGSATRSTVYDIAKGDNGVAIAGYKGKLGFASNLRGQWKTDLRKTKSFLGAAYGNGRFVVVGMLGQAYVRTDDVTPWKEGKTQTENSLRDVAFFNNRFFAVGDKGTFVSSQDGIRWENHDLSLDNDLSGICSDGKSIYIVGKDGLILSKKVEAGAKAARQINELEEKPPIHSRGHAVAPEKGWSKSIVKGAGRLSFVAYARGSYVAVSVNGVVVTSSDAITWKSTNLNQKGKLHGVAFGMNQWVVGGGGFPAPRITYVSKDKGVSWQLASNDNKPGILSVIHDGMHFYATSFRGEILKSEKGLDWEVGSLPSGNPIFGMAKVDSHVAVAGYRGLLGYTSQLRLAADWKRETKQPNNFYAVAHHNDRFVAVGVNGKAYYRDVGEGNWHKSITKVRTSLLDVKCIGSMFYAVGTEGTLISSPDGINWNKHELGTKELLGSLCASENKLVIVGDKGLVLRKELTPEMKTPQVLGKKMREVKLANPGVSTRRITYPGVPEPKKTRPRHLCAVPEDLKAGQLKYFDCWPLRVIKPVGTSEYLFEFEAVERPYHFVVKIPNTRLEEGEYVQLIGSLRVTQTTSVEIEGKSVMVPKLVYFREIQMALRQKEIDEKQEAEQNMERSIQWLSIILGTCAVVIVSGLTQVAKWSAEQKCPRCKQSWTFKKINKTWHGKEVGWVIERKCNRCGHKEEHSETPDQEDEFLANEDVELGSQLNVMIPPIKREKKR